MTSAVVARHLDELHDEVELVVRLVVLEKLHDVGVLDLAQDAQLALNHMLFTFALQLVDDLERVLLPLRSAVTSECHHSHTFK